MIKNIQIFFALSLSLSMLYAAEPIQWSQPATIPGSQNALNATMARDVQGNALVAWQISDNKMIRIAYYKAIDKSWSAVKELGSAYLKSYLYVSMNQEGDGIIAWIDKEQVVTTVNYMQENWQTWQPICVHHSSPSDKAYTLNMPQTFYSTAYLAWTSASGIYASLYTKTNNTWITQKTLYNGQCSNPSVIADTFGNVIFTWLTAHDQDKNTIYATRYDSTLPWAAWAPAVINIADSDDSICHDSAMSSPYNQQGEAIFVWGDSQGLHATLYNPDLPWQTWKPSDNQKIITSTVPSDARVVMDTFGNALIIWQSYTGYYEAAQYPVSQEWQQWNPASKTVVEDMTIANDIKMGPLQRGSIVLTSLESYRLNTLYVGLTDNQGNVDAPIAIARTCIPSTQKMIAFKPYSSSFDAMVVWPSVPSKGVMYILSE